MMSKKPYYIIGSIVVLAVLLFIYLSEKKDQKIFNHSLTFKKNDKIPYGAYVAFHSLSALFPESDIFPENSYPGYWKNISYEDSSQALIVLSPRFYPDDYEMRELISFAANGNDVFVSTRFISETVSKLAGISTASFFDMRETETVQLTAPYFPHNQPYTYNGMSYHSWLSDRDSSYSEVMGTGLRHRVNFIHLKAGKGNFYLHFSPISFSNYFLLHQQNIRYYEEVLSVISPNTHTIIWDEYFINKKAENNPYDDNKNEDDSNSLAELFKYKETKWAAITLLTTLVLYVLMEMRRRQRVIPKYEVPKNDSLDFVKTIGRLYYEKGSHYNLSKKMASYFLEHIRSRYKLTTNRLDEHFIEQLSYKTEYPQEELRTIVSFINQLTDRQTVKVDAMIRFHRQLEAFYKNT